MHFVFLFVFVLQFIEFCLNLHREMRIRNPNKNDAFTIVLVESLKFAERRLGGSKKYCSTSYITQFFKRLNVSKVYFFQIFFFKDLFLLVDPLVYILLCFPFDTAFSQYFFRWKIHYNTIGDHFTKVIDKYSIRTNDLIIVLTSIFFLLDLT